MNVDVMLVFKQCEWFCFALHNYTHTHTSRPNTHKYHLYANNLEKKKALTHIYTQYFDKY